MIRKRISAENASKIITLYVLNGLKQTQITESLGISLATVNNYVGYYNQSGLTKKDVLLLDKNALIDRVHPKNTFSLSKERAKRLTALLPEIHKRLTEEDIALTKLWAEYIEKEPSGYSYTQVNYKYNEWREKNNIKKNRLTKSAINHINPDELEKLNKWRLSSDRNKWEKAVIILEIYKGTRIREISNKIERTEHAIRSWVAAYKERGLEYFNRRRTRKFNDEINKTMEEKSENIIRLLHEPASLHNLNRTSWTLKTLSKAYKEHYGESISEATIARYIQEKGFRFKKAKAVLTSPDPDYRENLNNIKRILAGLKENEKFFSIAEYGPIENKARSGRSYIPKGDLKIVPGCPNSKGSLICAAALELSKNQITHIYTHKRNATEMIKLLMILLEKYKTEDCIYLSWDAASWHASKALDKKVAEVNEPKYRHRNKTPFVELAPLPARAQFLNVIESVFSGMTKSVIHNRDYQSEVECKEAIDRYFDERNTAFIKNPEMAGKEIWGEEEVKPIFTDSNTCKNPNY